MARPLRLEYPGALWHVMNRGVERRTIYQDDVDRSAFVDLLARTIVKYRWQLHAWVLMTNHYHLLFQTPDTNLSRGMKDLDGDYASSFNRRHSRIGHLFQGRFTGHLVDSNSYMLELSRYIVLNPVRAGLVRAVEEWPWSSYHATVGTDLAPAWLDPAPVLDHFDPLDRARACDLYCHYIAEGVGQRSSPWTKLAARMFLGTPGFLMEIERKIRARAFSAEHPKEQRRFRAWRIAGIRRLLERMDPATPWPPPAASPIRTAFVLLARRRADATSSEIGRALGITSQAAGRLLRSCARGLRDDTCVSSLIERVERSLPGVEGGFKVRPDPAQGST